MSKKITLFVGLITAFVLALSACGPAATPVPPTQAPVPTTAPATAAPAPTVDVMAQLVAAAQKEGTIVSYGLPDDWVNYGGLFKGFTAQYNITHQDTDMDSGTIISTLEAETTAPVADTTDLGLGFAKLVEDNKLSQPYKNSHWAEIPDYAKDPQGRWAAAYWGAIAFLVNADVVKTVPQTWQDLLNPANKNTVCMKNPSSSATAQMIVLGAAFANGGSETNVQPGLDFFKKMISGGILNGVTPSVASIQKGECPITIEWDFDALSAKDQNPNMNLQVVLPSDGTVAGMYIQFVTAGAPHANAAKLLLEYEFSDAGQLAYAQGFVHPIRTSVQLPADLLAKFPSSDAYKVVHFPKDYVALAQAGTDIANGWALIQQ
ncbi:MAG TPA: extracellular solute-binding protein [Anaerolineales bacterium]|nr:extracellular solute-binding protein [Anaerolineales bacterium]